MADPYGHVVGLDLGTTKVAVVIAENSGDGLRVIGVGVAPSAGLRRGVVVDVGKTVTAIQAAVDEAETAAGVEVHEVTVGLTGEHVRGVDSSGAVAVSGPGHEVTDADRQRAIDAARTVAIPFDREVLHVLPQAFAVDGQRGLRDPVGMSGIRLEADVHIVTGAVTSVQNLCRSVERAGLQVSDVVLEPLASSRAVLTEDEREMGVCLVDIGGGTTDIALYRQGSVRHTAVLGLGGQSVTNDIAICLRISWSQAERLKLQPVGAVLGQVETGGMALPGLAGCADTTVELAQLSDIVEARMEEIYRLVARRLAASAQAGELSAGVVLTGGGARIDGAVALAESVFERPVRLAAPGSFTGVGECLDSPAFATAVGLAQMAAEAQGSPTQRGVGVVAGGRLDGVAGRLKEWFSTLL